LEIELLELKSSELQSLMLKSLEQESPERSHQNQCCIHYKDPGPPI
jgi:hypothetical protein